MAELTKHWTESGVDDYLYRIASDFARQIAQTIETTGTSQAKLAKELGVSEGRVSQVLNNPGNLTLRKMIEYARALRRKVSIVAYNDNDPDNQNGPINAEVFILCWERAGKPSDFFALREEQPVAANSQFITQRDDRYTYDENTHAENLGFGSNPPTEIQGTRAVLVRASIQ